jgi:hypothetical protein
MPGFESGEDIDPARYFSATESSMVNLLNQETPSAAIRAKA